MRVDNPMQIYPHQMGWHWNTQILGHMPFWTWFISTTNLDLNSWWNVWWGSSISVLELRNHHINVWIIFYGWMLYNGFYPIIRAGAGSGIWLRGQCYASDQSLSLALWWMCSGLSYVISPVLWFMLPFIKPAMSGTDSSLAPLAVLSTILLTSL